MITKKINVYTSCSVLAAVFLSSSLGYAQTLQGALTQTYNTNPLLQAQQAATRATDEKIPRTQASYRPQVEASGSYSASNNNYKGYESSASSHSEAPSTSVTAKQKVLDFKYFPALESAEQEVAAARADLLGAEQKILLDAVVAYMSTYQAQQALVFQQHNVKFMEKQLESIQIRYDVGDVTRTDLAQAKSRLAQARAQLTEAQGQLEITKANYMKVVGEAPDALAKPDVDLTLPATLKELEDQSLEANPKLSKAIAAQKSARASVEQSERSFLPTVDLSTTAGRDWQRRGDRYRRDSTSVTATLTFPLDVSGAIQSTVRQAHDTFVKSKLEAEDAKRSTLEEAAKAWESYHVAKKRHAEYTDQIDAANVALESIQIEEEAGSRTILDVLDAQKELLNAQVAQIKAYQEYVVAAYQLLSAKGALTAPNLKLYTTYYDPAEHYNQVENKWWGLGDYFDDEEVYKT